jgi:large subunit ribosomal protein L24
MRKIKKDDYVIVIAGKEKGKTGKVLSVLNDAVFVEDLNIVKKHVKGNPNIGKESAIVAKEAPLNISNVAIFNPNTKKADRVGMKFLEDGKKVRFYKSTGEVI